jgi:D-arabinose 1-dehydrogenase-like Zn-dependent alcohol dehydrogenase
VPASGKVTSVVERTYTLSQAPDAIRDLHQGHAPGKAAILV